MGQQAKFRRQQMLSLKPSHLQLLVPPLLFLARNLVLVYQFSILLSEDVKHLQRIFLRQGNEVRIGINTAKGKAAMGATETTFSWYNFLQSITSTLRCVRTAGKLSLISVLAVNVWEARLPKVLVTEILENLKSYTSRE